MRLYAGVTIGASGLLYGTANKGGDAAPDCPQSGTVFELEPPAVSGGTWAEKLVYSFCNNGDPTVGVTIGSGGVLYGATTPTNTGRTHGSVFSLTPPASSGASWTFGSIWKFPYDVSTYPTSSSLAIGAGGVAYGTSSTGGAISRGGVRRGFLFDSTCVFGRHVDRDHPSRLHWQRRANPQAGVVIGPGAIYGTTYYGRSSNNGTVFSLTL